MSADCEGYFRSKFSIRTHGTPGISSSNSYSNSHSSNM